MFEKDLLEDGLIGEIDAIRRELENRNSIFYDRLSDKYFELIDLATSPDTSVAESHQLERVKWFMVENDSKIHAQLGKYGLSELYEQHIGQISSCLAQVMASPGQQG
jgi:hypothetical protein